MTLRFGGHHGVVRLSGAVSHQLSAVPVGSCRFAEQELSMAIHNMVYLYAYTGIYLVSNLYLAINILILVPSSTS